MLAKLIHQTLHKSAVLCNGFSSVSLGYNVCLMEVLRKALGCYKLPSLLFIGQLIAEICFSTKWVLSLSKEYMLTIVHESGQFEGYYQTHILIKTYVGQENLLRLQTHQIRRVKTKKLWLGRMNCRQHQSQRLILVIVEVHSIAPVAAQTDRQTPLVMSQHCKQITVPCVFNYFVFDSCIALCFLDANK